MDEEYEPPNKKVKESKCFICLRPLSSAPYTKNPTTDGLQTLWKTAQIRQDAVFDRLLPMQEKILSGETCNISFHRNCRSSYTTTRNVMQASSRRMSGETISGETSTQDNPTPSNSRASRAETATFNVRTDCFICGHPGNKRVKSGTEKLTQISTGSGQTTHEKTLRAAIERHDETVRVRMLAYPDLFAYDAKYHRSCYSTFITPRNIQAAGSKFVDLQSKLAETPQERGFRQLCEEIRMKTTSKEKTVLFLSDLTSRFSQILLDLGVAEPDSCRSWKLKERLKGHFGDSLVFIPQPGKSDFVCSKDLTLGDALQKVNTLQLHVENSDGEELDFSVPDSESSHSMTLHRAASILRSEISRVSFRADSYPSSGEIGISQCTQFVPTPLLNFMNWLCSKTAFECGTTITESNLAESSLLPLVAICHDIIGLSTNITTPIPFCLAVQMHHKFGSRQLIDDLNSLGHAVSYGELRHFLTSIAEEDLKQGDTYIPRGIGPYQADDVQTIVDAAIDNFDQNEETLDGKSTTHCMAAVLYQRSANTVEVPGIPRSKSRSLDVSNYDEGSIHMYKKPTQRPQPHRVAETSLFDVKSDTYQQAVLSDLVWAISRHRDANGLLPAWSGFNSLVTGAEIPVAIVRYLPFINAPPTEFSTIYSIVQKLITIAMAQGQHHILVTADLAIYSKAQQILWEKTDLQKRVTMRLGAMHLIMAFLGSIGKLYGDGGFQSCLTGSGVYAPASAQLMIQGKHYARGIRGVKLVHEAMTHLYLTAAETFAEEKALPWVDEEINSLIICLQDSPSRETCQKLQEKLGGVMETLSNFKSAGCKQSETFKYWCSFLEAGDVLLHLLRANKEGDFHLHLDAAMEAVPYFILAGRVNYARYTPVYVSEMRQLETKQPEMFKFLEQGGFVVRRSGESKFNSVPTDQALEQSINRDAKTTGGIIGFTRRKAALLRWLVTRHATSQYSESFKELCGGKSLGRSHDELGQTRKARDRNDVLSVIAYITDSCENPFDLNSVPSELVNISSGKIATKPVVQSLTTIPGKGKGILDNFIAQRLVDGGEKDFWDAVPKSVATTFESMKKSLSFDKAKKLLLDPEVLFRRLLCVARHREINLKDVLSYELTPVPPALFHDDGAMRKVTKSDLASKLEERCQKETVLKSEAYTRTAYIIDGMSLVQSVNETHFQTFDDLGQIILKRLTRLLKNPDLHIEVETVVFDRYDVDASLNIKGGERQRRGDSHEHRASHKVIGNRKVPNYKQFLKSGKNKAELIYFLSQYIEARAPDMIAPDKTLVIAGGYPNPETVKQISAEGPCTMENLASTQAEADTRIVLHATHSASFPRTIVRCDDTDVLVLLLHYQSGGMLSREVYMHAGHAGKFTTKERFIPVTKIAEEVGPLLCSILPAMHALSGCDTTSGFFKIGKRTAFNALQKHQDELKGLSEFNSPGPEVGMDSARKFGILIYKGRKDRLCKTLDELRLIHSSTTDKPVVSLPPTEDAFQQHALRAKYQTMVWCSSHIAKPEVGDPCAYGWTKSGENLVCIRTLKESAPSDLRNLTHLYCQDSSCIDGAKCPCLQVGLPCIEACKCSDCPNTVRVEQDNGDGDGDGRSDEN